MRYTFGVYELDTERFELLRSGEPVSMEPQTFEVLSHLVQHPDRVVSRQELLDAVWGTTYISDAALATRIKEARRAVGDDGQAQRMIRTVHGRGYRFVGNDEAPPPPSAVSGAEHAELPAPSSLERSRAPRTRTTPFVGRERELATLREALDAALGGAAGTVLIAGEPGIGKTRLAQEIEADAREHGMLALWGRAQEFAGAPPYWPWLQVFDDYRTATPEAALREQMAPYATELQRLLPFARENGDVAAPDGAEAAEPEDAQFAMLQALSGLLRAASRRQPLLLILEDLHWADAATLRLLVHLARHVHDAPLLVIGTYRDTDLARSAPLHRALAELSREPSFERIELRGFTPGEVDAYVRETALAHPPASLVSRLSESTEGNPFFLSEVVKLMQTAGQLSDREQDVELAVPAGVQQVLDRRLDQLGVEVTALLSAAAAIGREFDHQLIAEITDHDEDALISLLEDALDAHVIEEGEVLGEYRFTHALMQEALLRRLSPPRRARMHGQIAEALERLGGPTRDQHAPALAAHYLASAALNREHARPAAHYSRLAAEQARAQLAWDDAARHYRHCLDLVTVHEDRLGQDEASLWLELALSQLANGRFLRGDAARRALALWPPEDAAGLAAALLRIFAAEPAPPMVRYLAAPLDRAVEALGPQPSEAACALLAWKAMAVRGEGGDEAAGRADELARALGLEGERYPVALRVRPGRVALDSGRFHDAVDAFEQLEAESGDAALISVSLLHQAYTHWPAGDLDRTEAAVRRLLELNREHRTQRSGHNQLAWLAFIEWRRGRPDAALALLADVPRDLNIPAVDLLRPEIAITSDDLDRALAELPVEDVSPWLFFRAERLGMRCRILALRGDQNDARAAFREWRAAFDRVEEGDLLEYLFALHSIDDVLCEFADEALLTSIQRRLDPLDELRNWWLGSGPDYLRGAIALRRTALDAAAHHFDAGVRWAEDAGVPLVAGRCHEGLAAVARQRGDLDTARSHTDTARAHFEAIGASLYLRLLERDIEPAPH